MRSEESWRNRWSLGQWVGNRRWGFGKVSEGLALLSDLTLFDGLLLPLLQMGFQGNGENFSFFFFKSCERVTSVRRVFTMCLCVFFFFFLMWARK